MKYGVSVMVSDRLINDALYQKKVKFELYEKAVRELTKQICDGKRYTIRLNFSKQPIFEKNYYDVLVKYNYEWEITEVQIEQLRTVELSDAYKDLRWRELSFTAIDEIKRRLKNKLRNIWSKIKK